MRSTDVIDAVAGETGLQKQHIGAVLDAFVRVVTETIRNGGELRYRDLGIFAGKQRGARKGRNPRTGDAVEIPAMRAVKFKPAAELKRGIQANGA